MRNSRTNIILSILLILFFGDCKKKEDLDYFPLDQNFKDFIYFKNDSYWIYENEDGITDTQKVINSIITECHCIDEVFNDWIISRDHEYIQEFLEYEIISSLDSSIIEVNGGTRCGSEYDPESKFDCFWANYNSNVIFVWYPKSGFEYYRKSDFFRVKLISWFDSLLVHDKYYYDIIEMWQYDNHVETSFFFARNYGLVRKIETNMLWPPDTIKWDLIDSKIIQ
ncbi:MAG: hypothetical protein GXO79_05540 [Chlorobi bacterium]|nr:hypothetical protein [Chlorobiota bacterium]